MTVVTVIFLRVFISFIIYITIYISISYKVFKEDIPPCFLIVTTVTVTTDHDLLLYEALQCPEQFVEPSLHSVCFVLAPVIADFKTTDEPIYQVHLLQMGVADMW
jgi:hypothetical protein